MKKNLLPALLCLVQNAAFAQMPYTELFCPVDTAWGGKTIVLPKSPLQYSILMKSGDIVYNLEKGNNAPVKGGFGTPLFDETNFSSVTTVGSMNITKATEGWLYVSLLDNAKSPAGDGGGLVQLRVREKTGSGEWEVVPQTSGSTTYNARFFDMSVLGESVGNNMLHLGYSNLSSTTTLGNLFMFDAWANSNTELSGVSNLSDYTLPAGSPDAGKNIPRYQNTGWIMEIERKTGKPVRKLYHAGRGNFGGLKVMSEISSGSSAAKTIVAYITTQTQPAVLLRYELKDNKLSAYKQDVGSYGGKWIVLNDLDVDGSVFPFSFSDLVDVQRLALLKGATMFNRLGAIKGTSTKFWVAETGGNSETDAFTDPAKAYNGKMATHLQLRDADNDGKFTDPYGRILIFESLGGVLTCKPFLEGGTTKDGRYTFSNPKSLSLFNFNYVPIGGTTAPIASYMAIGEEVPDASYGRNPAAAVTSADLMNEIYFLDMSKASPDLSDLRPFAIGPKGAEIQAVFSDRSRWSPLFVSLRYPNSSNDAPYNESLLLSLNNFQEYFDKPTSCSWISSPPGTGISPLPTGASTASAFEVWPNPAQRMLFFNKEYDVQLYNINGQLLKDRHAIKALDVFDLPPGTYFIRNQEGEVKKIIVQ